MGVNSAFKSFFNNRLMVTCGIPIAIGIVLLAILFIASSFKKRSDRDLIRAKQANIIMRQIGHLLLLQSGDATSRVLPVTEIREGTFLLTFENEFVFNHDSLMMLTQGLLPKTQFPSGYTVTVHECITARIVYGFQINNFSPDILACKGRSQPAGCYTIEIAIPDLYENVEQKEANLDQPTQRLKKVDPHEANTKLEQKKTDIDQLTEELKSFKVGPQGANPIPPIAIGTEEFKTTTFDYTVINLVCSGMLVLLSVALLNRHFGKILIPMPVQSQDHAIIKGTVPEFPTLGKFLFDVKEQRLLPTAPIAIGGMGSEVISLTGKECKILELLNHNFGELIPRETLMQEVWLNEGVITGRSLDMFVSKLRKKLSADPELRITNVHGKGYKLEIPGIQIL